MRIVANREQLLKAFTAAASVAPSRSPKEVLNNVKMIAAGGGVLLQATDMEIWLSLEAQGCQVQFPGEVLLPVARTSLILRESPDDEITIEDVGNEIHLNTKSSSYKLPSADPKEYPSKAPVLAKAYHQMSSDILLAAIKRTAFATDPDSTRYALGGVLWVLEDKTCTVIGTDGRRLAAANGQAEAGLRDK